MKRARIRREAGSALVITVLLLVLLGVMGLAALDTVTRDQQVAGFQNKNRLAFYAAEAGVADATDRLRAVFSIEQTVNLPATLLSDATVFPYGQPSYAGDPNAVGGVPIAFTGRGAIDLGGGNDLREGSEQWFNTLWRIQVQGSTPDGATSRIDAMATRTLAGGNAY